MPRGKRLDSDEVFPSDQDGLAIDASAEMVDRIAETWARIGSLPTISELPDDLSGDIGFLDRPLTDSELDRLLPGVFKVDDQAL